MLMAMEDAKCADSPHVIFRKGLFDGMDARTLVRIIGLEVIVFLFAVASAWMHSLPIRLENSSRISGGKPSG